MNIRKHAPELCRIVGILIIFFSPTIIKVIEIHGPDSDGMKQAIGISVFLGCLIFGMALIHAWGVMSMQNHLRDILNDHSHKDVKSNGVVSTVINMDHESILKVAYERYMGKKSK